MRLLRDPRAWIAIAAVLLALCFLGSRGLWDPDEGRYTNVALTMLDSGDWINPRRNADVGHWTKPPVTYWAIAASVKAFGPSPWAVRLPMGLAYLGCVWLSWRTARRLAPGRETVAALAYMSMLMPFIASQLVTTDFLLAFFQAMGVFAFVEGRFREEGPGRWPWLMWVAFACAFMTKGPPALLPLAVVLVFQWLAPSPRPQSTRTVLGGVLLFLLLALPWFAIVIYEHAGLLRYFLGAEVVDRVASDRFARHGEWYGWLEIYLPTLLVGTLPWTLPVLRWARGLPASVRAWRHAPDRQAQAPALLLALWVLLPLAVFCIARSRLPLYLLPIFVPLALVVARNYAPGKGGLPAAGWIAGWALVLVAVRIGSALYPSDQDASAWARALRERVPGPIHEVAFIEDMPRYGLHLYLQAEVETLSLDAQRQAAFNPEFDESFAAELAEGAQEPGIVYVAKQKIWPAVQQRVSAQGHAVEALGAPYQKRIVFRVRPD